MKHSNIFAPGDVKPLTSEEAKALLEEGRRRRHDFEERKKKPPECPTGTCVVCKGTVKGEYIHDLEPNTDWRSVPIGPGSSKYYSWIFQGYHCEGCGLVYKFVPGAKKEG